MVQPKCPNCDSTDFTNTPRLMGANQVLLIHCDACGTVVGALPALNLDKRLKDIYDLVAQIRR